MSYLRCTSNPESLYVFGSTSNKIEFYWRDHNNVDQHGWCEEKIFDTLMRNAAEQELEPTSQEDGILAVEGLTLKGVTWMPLMVGL